MKLTFPDDFIFGVADADLQVIGEDSVRKFESSEQTIWDFFAANSGRVHNNSTPGIGADRYSNWKKDIELMQRLNISHYRTSISMSRTLMRNGEVNPKAIAWYKNYFKLLKASNIKIYATIYHWELPQYIQEVGGWESPLAGEMLIKHAKVVAENLGEYIDEFFILNEPWCASILSYFLGVHAPGKNSLKSALLAAHNLLVTQGIIFEELTSISKEFNISTVFNSEPAYAATSDPKDILAARYADGSFNRWFYDALFIGRYPEDMVELYGKNMPVIKDGDMKTIKIGGRLKTMGMNYYNGNLVKFDDNNELKGKNGILRKGGEINGIGWPIFKKPHYPEGLYDILSQIYYSYRDYGLKRIMVTENGMALRSTWDKDHKKVLDTRRIEYYKENIKQVHDAILRGIPIEGYFAWTFMDNYEWAEGYRPDSAFGLVHVDWKTMKRTPKESAHWYKKLIETHVLEI